MALTYSAFDKFGVTAMRWTWEPILELWTQQCCYTTGH